MKVSFYETTSGRSPVQDFIEGISKSDKARFAEVFENIEKHGFGCPRVTFKPLRGKLWEIKFQSVGGKYRIAYIVVEADTMVWLHVFRKSTQKTPIKNLELAEKRMKEVLGS